jgi:hypothetical protein
VIHPNLLAVRTWCNSDTVAARGRAANRSIRTFVADGAAKKNHVAPTRRR